MKKPTELFEGKGEMRGFTFTRLKCARISFRKWAFVHQIEKEGAKYYETTIAQVRHNGFSNEYRLALPVAAEFGKRGWCYSNLIKAMEKFNQIIINN